MYPQQAQPLGAIGLELRFGLFRTHDVTSEGFFSRKYNTRVEVDGTRWERDGGAWHVFPVYPGWHLVRVSFLPRPTLLSRPTGARQIQVLVYPGAMSRLVYTGAAFWPLGGATLTQVG